MSSLALQRFIEQTRRRRVRVAVVGDVLVDQYVHGTMTRFSPEAPVPILHTEHGEPFAVPGGAANVAYQLRHWNVDVKLLGLLDAATSKLLDRYQIDTAWSLSLPTGRNPIKHRFYAGDQPCLRHDVERPCYGEGEIQALRVSLFARLEGLLHEGLEVLVLSDYDKGLFDTDLIRRILDTCRAAGVPTIVDPKGRTPQEYAGCTVFKPNRKYMQEKGRPCVFPENIACFRNVLAPCEALICTRGPDGPLGFVGEHLLEPIVIAPRGPVVSVIGAGDCFAAHLALAQAHQIPLALAASIAHAAGLAYVQADHNRPVLPQEVLRQVDPVAGKMVTVPDLQEILLRRWPQGRVVFTNGTFDLCHGGHVATLQWANQQGDVLVVGINDDASVTRLKGPGRPVLPLQERMKLLAAMGCVDYVVAYPEDTPEELIKILRPNVLVKGPEFYLRREQIAGFQLVPETLTAPQTSSLLHSRDIIKHILSSPLAVPATGQ